MGTEGGRGGGGAVGGRFFKKIEGVVGFGIGHLGRVAIGAL